MITPHRCHLPCALPLLTHFLLLTDVIKGVAVTPCFVFQMRKLRGGKKRLIYMSTQAVLGAELGRLTEVCVTLTAGTSRTFGNPIYRGGD